MLLVVGILEDQSGEGRSIWAGEELDFVVEASLQVKYLVCLVFLQDQFLSQIG